jgi:putative transposase
MLRFRRMKTLQKFSSIHAAFHNHFNQDRHLINRHDYKVRRLAAKVALAAIKGENALAELAQQYDVQT